MDEEEEEEEEEGREDTEHLPWGKRSLLFRMIRRKYHGKSKIIRLRGLRLHSYIIVEGEGIGVIEVISAVYYK